jgi:FKBP-type peptidyl-prolyl cis-trans isomerase FkpA
MGPSWWMRLVLTALVLIAAGPRGSAADDAKPEPEPKVVKLDSGLKYQDLKVGTGATAKAGYRVTVHYTGWLAKGKKKFDSSKDRDEPFAFELGAGKVIKGFDEGITGMKVGGKRKLMIPAKLGYGAKGAGDAIPPDADLVFEVELLKLEK